MAPKVCDAGSAEASTCSREKAIRGCSQPAMHQVIPLHLKATCLHMLPRHLLIPAAKPCSPSVCPLMSSYALLCALFTPCISLVSVAFLAQIRCVPRRFQLACANAAFRSGFVARPTQWGTAGRLLSSPIPRQDHT